MKTLLIGEYREGKLLDTTYELLGFAKEAGAESSIFIVADANSTPNFSGKLYLSDVNTAGEYNPDLHRELILKTIEKENPDTIVFIHSSYGWDLAPRVAARLKAAQISEVVALKDGCYEVGNRGGSGHSSREKQDRDEPQRCDQRFKRCQ